MKFKQKISIAIAGFALSASQLASAQTLLNASYDVSREFYKDFNAAFVANYKKTAGKVEQIGTPQEVWDHPASPFVYGFLGDVSLFHGRAHEGEMLIGEDHHGLRLATPEHSAVQDSQAFAYVRPHDLDVQRYVAGASAAEQPRGIVAKLTRAMVIGPIARLELLPLDTSASGSGDIIEAQIPAQHYRELGFNEGDMLVLTPRRARVFVAP